MGYMGRKSQLRSDTIKKAILNKKDYIEGDITFKFVKSDYGFGFKSRISGEFSNFSIEVYNFEKLILKINYEELTKQRVWKGRQRGMEEKEVDKEKKFDFEVVYFNPQTDNDVFSINHIIAKSRELLLDNLEHKDKGNVDVFNNQYTFRKKPSFYGFTFVWERGEIKQDNFHKDLSYDFATNEYVSQIKKIYKCKKIQRRAIKKSLENAIGRIKKEKILESLKLDGEIK